MNRALLAAAGAMLASPALAHVDPLAHGAFAAGLSHPTGGADHLVAMVAVGLYASVLGGAARWALPCGFASGMALGFLAALAALPIPFVEPMILASVILLGLMLAVAFRPSTAAATGIIALFGLFHGHAHGGELGYATAFGFGTGLLVGTVALHTAGVAAGSRLLARGGGSPLLRAMIGTATAATGLALAFV